MDEVRAATETDLDRIREVAQAAGERFREVTDPRVSQCADDPPPSREELSEAVHGGRLLVAVQEGTVVGFALLAVVDGRAHLEEISVDPSAQSRGHGTGLLDAVDVWSTQRSLDGVTLTTFSDVPWNRPYYERRGFAVLERSATTAGLRDLIDHEAALGLDPALRVAMFKPPA